MVGTGKLYVELYIGNGRFEGIMVMLLIFIVCRGKRRPHVLFITKSYGEPLKLLNALLFVCVSTLIGMQLAALG